MADSEEQEDGGGQEHGGSTAVRAVVAAAASGVTAYAVKRAVAKRHEGESDDDEQGDVDEDDDERDDEQSRGGIGAKKDEITDALAAKVSDVKQAAGKLRPGTSSNMGDASSRYVTPVVGEAAEALGRSLAKGGPDLVREEFVPRFIKGFEKAR